MQDTGAIHSEEAMRLLGSVAEQLKMPLATIARQAELGQLTGEVDVVGLQSIRTHAAAALTLVDSYLLGLQLMREQTSLQLEPVSVSSTLLDTANELNGFARQYGAELELCVGGRYEPVMAHAKGLKSALLALGYALLESYPAQNSRLVLAVHRTPRGLVTGIYGDYERLNTEEWRRALLLSGRAPQPLAALAGNSAGLFVADMILQAMATRLRVGKYLKQHGLAMTLLPSQQLRLV